MLKTVKQRLRRQRLEWLGITETLSLPTESLGVGDCAWTVWTEGLTTSSIVYSFGIGEDISFDRAIIKRLGLTVHSFDPTPACVDWIRSQVLPATLHYHDYGIGGHDGVIEFHAPRRESSPHFTPVKRYLMGSDTARVAQGQVHRLESIMQMLGHDRLDLLKIDIEGGEYEVIDDILASHLAIDQIAIEFHHNYATIPLSRTINAVRKLTAAGYRVIYISPRTYEMTLVHESAAPVER